MRRCSDVLTSMSVAIGTSGSKFTGAVDKTGRIYMEGTVRSGQAYLTKIGGFDVELAVTGSVLLTRQVDQPGVIGKIGTLLAADNVNINFMTVCRDARGQEAIMAIGIDEEPPATGERPAGSSRPLVGVSSSSLQTLACLPACLPTGLLRVPVFSAALRFSAREVRCSCCLLSPSLIPLPSPLLPSPLLPSLLLSLSFSPSAAPSKCTHRPVHVTSLTAFRLTSCHVMSCHTHTHTPQASS